MTRLSSGLSTGVDAIMGVVTGSSTGLTCFLSVTDVVGVTGVPGVTGSLSFETSGSSPFRVLVVTGVVTGIVGLFVIGIVGASNDTNEVVMGVLSRGRGPTETPRSTGGPSLGNWSWWGIRVPYALICALKQALMLRRCARSSLVSFLSFED